MNLWMHGIGQDIATSVQTLKSLGFKAVVGNDPLLIEEGNTAGMDIYLYSGAFGASGVFSDEKYLARDFHGQTRIWFNSACPNQPSVRSANLESISSMAQTPGIRGILIDGARFASPASSTNPDAFYTCFCPTCMNKAESLGFDPETMQTAAKNLYRVIHSGSAETLLTHLQGIVDWFSFRRKCTTEHLLNFCKTVKGVNPKLLTGIYIFTPALSYLVGQSYEDLIYDMDIFAPMIYRAYTAAEGPACLNHEVSALVKELSRSLFTPQNAVKFLSGLMRLPMDGLKNDDDVLNGLPTEAIGCEVSRAKSRLNRDHQLIPIIQLDDPQLEESIHAVQSAGADGVNFFVYQEEWLEKNHHVFEKLEKQCQ